MLLCRLVVTGDVAELSAFTFRVVDYQVDPEDGGSRFLRNVGNCLPLHMTSYPGRRMVIVTVRREQESHNIELVCCDGGHLTLYVPCIVTNYINKPTRCTFCMYLFYNFCTTLHVSKDHFVHHQEFMIYCILQLCTKHANVSKCLVLKYSVNSNFSSQFNIFFFVFSIISLYFSVFVN